MKIAYKIFMPLLLLAVFPVLYFMPLLHVAGTVGSNSLNTMINLPEYSSVNDIVKMSGDTDPEQRESIKEIIKMLMDKNSSIGAQLPNTKYLYPVAVFGVLMLLLTLAAAVLAFTKHYGITTGLTGGALLSAVGVNVFFGKFAEPILTGEINLTSVMTAIAGTGNISNSILSSLGDSLGGLGSILAPLIDTFAGLLGKSILNISSLELAVGFTFALLLLIFALIFSLIVAVMQRYAK